jgi:arylsulfatase A-like enzyme
MTILSSCSPATTDGLSGFKDQPVRAGHALPLIVRVPSQQKRGGICNAMVSWVDFAPTILDYCAVTVSDSPAVSGVQETGPARRRAATKQKYTFHGRSWAGLWDQEESYWLGRSLCLAYIPRDHDVLPNARDRDTQTQTNP